MSYTTNIENKITKAYCVLSLYKIPCYNNMCSGHDEKDEKWLCFCPKDLKKNKTCKHVKNSTWMKEADNKKTTNKWQIRQRYIFGFNGNWEGLPLFFISWGKLKPSHTWPPWAKSIIDFLFTLAPKSVVFHYLGKEQLSFYCCVAFVHVLYM